MKYYYLIPSLNELKIDDTSLAQEQLEDSVDLIFRNLTDEDLKDLKGLFYPNDNQNLLFILFHEYHDFEIRTFNKPSAIPLETLQNYRREMATLPDYLINYLSDLSGSFPSFSLRKMEQSLNSYFYEYLLQRNSTFLNTYYFWKYTLDKTIAEVNLKAYPFMQAKNDQEEPFFSDIRTLHSLTEPSEIAAQITPLIASNNLEAIELKINGYYWEFANSWQEPFSKEQVFAYMVKLLRLHRWNGFTSKGELAKTKFEELITELKQKTSSPKMPLI